MDTQPNSSLIHTWKEQIRRVAARNPRLARQLWQNRQVYFDRFALFYRQLATLPRKFRRKFLKRLATTLAGAALLLALGQALPARAATITVDGMTCTLAEAIDSANNDNAAGNGCADGNGADVIDLQTDVLLTAALPSITSEITLEGNAHTMDGNNSFQVLNIQASGDLTLNDASITGGYVLAGNGGGIGNQGTLTVNDSIITGNSVAGAFTVSGGGVYNIGMLTVNNSIVSDNSAYFGGGIANGFFSYLSSGGTVIVNNSIISGNSAVAPMSTSGGGGIGNVLDGEVTVNHSTISNNSTSGIGGGIFNAETMIVNNSTLSGNSATSGGAMWNYYSATVAVNNSTLSDNDALGSGGGIHNGPDSVVQVNNSTLSGNQANGYGGGGGFRNDGTAVVHNSTLSGNSGTVGGGFSNLGCCSTTSLNRSLISGNTAPSGAEVFRSSGVINSNNYNVVGYDGSARSYGFTPGPNDIIPPGALDTVLDITLSDNGGPTFTHALVAGSVAIDAAPDGDCLAPPINGIDQRSYFRNVDGDGNPSANECDAGAFEYGSSMDTPTPTNTFTPTSTSTPTTTPTFTPTSTSTATTSPTVTPTSTNTPTPTNTPVPGFKVYLPLIVRQDGTQVAAPQSGTTNPLMNFVVVTLLALGNLFLFRKRQP